ncbi:hypothetical protein Btru_055316 [Bulinus truncatus]|nr:hypothetical protein Btru_055316 [Bulinus truncatus]
MITLYYTNFTLGTTPSSGDLDPVPSYILDIVDLIFSSVLTNVLPILGLLGTSINIIVLSRYNITTDSSNILLVSLCVADFFFCVTAPISHCNNFLSSVMESTSYIKLDKLSFQYFELFGRTVYCTSITLVGVISAERFLVVYFPFRASSFLTFTRMKAVAVCVYVVNVSLFSPLFNMFKTEWVFDEFHGDYIPLLLPTDFYLNNYKEITLVLGVIYNNVVLGTSILLTLILTPATAVKLWFVTSTRSKLTRRKCKFEPQVAKILITVCTINLIIYGPFICYDSALNLMGGYAVTSNSFRLYLIVTDFSGTLTASVNFVIYVTMSKKFRNSFKRLFQKCRIFQIINQV